MPDGSFKLDLKPDADPVKEVEISIELFHNYKKGVSRNNPLDLISQNWS